MSRAFVKEGEVGDPVCPGDACGGAGEPVTKETLRAHLVPEAFERLPKAGFFCANPSCRVAYFDGWGGVATVDDLTAPVWPKAADAPICACLGLTEDDVIEDAAAGRKDRIRDIVWRAEDGGGACATNAPDGRSCVLAVRRLFQAHFRPPGGL
ncbi:MAG: hypothetical protein ACF8XB_01370 [Planctomycetota bacterium JB042]